MEARTLTLSDLATVFDGADGVLMLLHRDDLDLFVVTKTPPAGEPILFTEAVLLYVALVYEVAGLRAAGALRPDEGQAVYSQLVPQLPDIWARMCNLPERPSTAGLTYAYIGNRGVPLNFLNKGLDYLFPPSA